MKAGNFNIYSYLDKLNEEAEMAATKGLTDPLGIIIPDENKKVYNWLKSEYQKGKTEVKVEMNMGGAKFEPGYDMQGNVKSTDSFKPGMYGEVKTSDTKPDKKNVSQTDASAGVGKDSDSSKSDDKADDKTNVGKSTDKNEGSKKSKIDGSSIKFNIKTKNNDKQ